MRNHDPVSRKCEKCTRVFSKVEHLRRHQRSRKSGSPLSVFSLQIRVNGHTNVKLVVAHMHEGDLIIDPDDDSENDGLTPQIEGGNESQDQETTSPTSLDGRTQARHDFPQQLNPSLTEGSTASPHNPAFESDLPPILNFSWTARPFEALPLDVGDQISPSARPPSNGFDSAIDASLGFDSLVGPPFDFSNTAEACNTAILEDLFLEILSSGHPSRPSGRKRSISYGQLEQVRRLWPTRRRSQAPTDPGVIWDDIILHDEDNLFSSRSLDTPSEPSDPSDPTPLNSTWGLTKGCRNRLLNDCVNNYVSNPLNPSLINGFRQSVDLPEVDILDLCLDLYFYNLHPLLPFVHAPTFNASKTPTILLFPMCLLGFMMFNRPAAQVVLNRYLLYWLPAACYFLSLHQLPLIATLVLSDSYSSHMLGVTPVLDPEIIHMPFLSGDALFEARAAEKWKQKLAGRDPWDPSHALSLDVRSPSIETSSFGVIIALAKVWLRISTRSRLLRGSRNADTPESSSITLVDIAAHDEGARFAIHELLLAYDIFRPELQHGNTNSVVMWNLLGLCVTCNLYTIELAAGRHGPAVAQDALEAVTSWAQTATARRACLHAAQIFIILHNQRRSDGIMLHSEMALFTAALVMGFYALVAPNATAASNTNESSSSLPVVDLLEEIDWTQIGSEGLGLHTGPTPLPAPTNPAVQFIRNGGPISFAGVQYADSYGMARRIFMYYGAQLSEVGRWNIEEYCHVLKIIGDTTIPAPFPQDQTVH
uniref:Zinc finger protein rst2 n=1 Tax=Talaromyces marneffei PM1 TaxID=1077442 RepID=A0A093VM65_TALMA